MESKTFLAMKFTTQHVLDYEHSRIRVPNFITRKVLIEFSFYPSVQCGISGEGKDWAGGCVERVVEHVGVMREWSARYPPIARFACSCRGTGCEACAWGSGFRVWGFVSRVSGCLRNVFLAS